MREFAGAAPGNRGPHYGSTSAPAPAVTSSLCDERVVGLLIPSTPTTGAATCSTRAETVVVALLVWRPLVRAYRAVE